MEIGKSQGFYHEVYYDPEPDEIIALTKSFDTLRIGFKLEKNQEHLVVGSGYGNTHSTLSRCIEELNPRQKPNRDGIKYGGLEGSLILYEENRRLWFNACDIGMSEKTEPERVLRALREPSKSLLKEIIRLSKEQQNLI